MDCIVWWIWLLEILSTFDALHLWVRCSYFSVFFGSCQTESNCFSVVLTFRGTLHWITLKWVASRWSPSDSVPRCAKDPVLKNIDQDQDAVKAMCLCCAEPPRIMAELTGGGTFMVPSYLQWLRYLRHIDQSASIDYTYYTSWDLIWLVQVWAIVPHILYSTHSCGLHNPWRVGEVDSGNTISSMFFLNEHDTGHHFSTRVEKCLKS